MKFEKMNEIQLRQFIDGCHARRQYDSIFDAACLVFNSRFR